MANSPFRDPCREAAAPPNEGRRLPGEPALPPSVARRRYHVPMCRNIKTLANFAPPATDDEIRASALQFVRKLSGTSKPSKANDAAFNTAVEEVTAAAER